MKLRRILFTLPGISEGMLEKKQLVNDGVFQIGSILDHLKYLVVEEKTAIFTSPTLNARQTAEIMSKALQVPIVIVNDLQLLNGLNYRHKAHTVFNAIDDQKCEVAMIVGHDDDKFVLANTVSELVHERIKSLKPTTIPYGFGITAEPGDTAVYGVAIKGCGMIKAAKIEELV